MKTCDFKTSEASTKAWFRTNGIIDKYLNIIDLGKFRKKTKQFSKHAHSKYGVKGWLFYEEQNGTKAVPNSSMFKAIDRSKGINYPSAFETKFSNDNLLGEKSILNSLEQSKKSKKNNIELINKFILTDSKNSISTRKVISNILSNFAELNDKSQDLLYRLKLLYDNVDSTIKFVKPESLQNEDTIMEYRDTTNSIYISREKLINRSLEDVVSDIMHESVHNVTHYILNGQSSSANAVKAKIEIEKLFDFYKKHTESTSRNFKDIHEFVTEAYSNKYFQEELKQIEINNTPGFAKMGLGLNVWQSFVKFISNFFNTSTNYDKLIDNIITLIKETQPSVYLGNNIYQKKDDNINIRTSLTKTTDRVDKLYNKLLTNVGIQARQLQKFKTKKGESIHKYTKSLKKELEKYEEVNKIKGILIYINNIEKQLKGLHKSLSTKDMDIDNMKFVLKNYNNYKTLYSTIDDIIDLYHELEQEGVIKHDPNKDIWKKLQSIKSDYEFITNKKINLSRALMLKEFSKLKNNRQLEAKWGDKFDREYNEVYALDKQKLKNKTYKENWISNKITDNIQVIEEEGVEEARKLIYNNKVDISSFDRLFLSSVQSNSKIVQLFQGQLSESRNKIIEKVEKIDKDISIIDTEIKKNNSKSSAKKIFNNLIEHNDKGLAFLKGEYKIEFLNLKNKLEELSFNINNLKSKINNSESKENLNELQKLNSEYKTLYKKLYKVNSETLEITIRPIWKNSLNDLTNIEKKTLDFFRDKAKESNSLTFGISSLIIKKGKAEFFQLPRIPKSDLERILDKDVKGLLKDKKDFLTKRRNDDFEYVNYEKVDASGEIINEVPIHYRGNIDVNDQSYDLSTLYKLELQMAISFNEFTNTKHTLDSFIEVIENTNTLKTKGVTNSGIFNIFNKKNKDQFAISESEKNKNSEIVKKLKGMMQTQVFNITKESSLKISGIDVNKLISYINAHTGMLGMTLNYHSALVNLAGGYTQALMHALASDIISIKSLKKAHNIYIKDFSNNLKDINNTYDESFTNQLLRTFDVFGGFNIGTETYLDDNLSKKFLKTNSLQFMHSMGEHQLQAIITMAVLDNIKGLNENGISIDKNGKETVDNGASLLDLIKKDQSGNLIIDNNLKFTNFSRFAEWDKGGKSIVQRIVKDKITKLFGMYDNNLQPEIMKSPVGRLGLMYRKFFFPMLMARFRGIKNVGKSIDNIKEEDKYFNEANLRYEEGMYVTTFRYLKYSLPSILKTAKLEIATKEWSKLTDFEKANIRKFIVETAIFSITSLLSALIAAAAEDDDDELLYFAAYTLRRVQSETNQFLNPSEFMRMMKSPFASMRTIDNSLDILTTIVTPWSWDDKYESGARDGQYKALRSIEKMIPVLSKKGRTNEQMYNFLESSMFGN